MSEKIVGRNKSAIVPHLNFSCNGRITSIRAGVKKSESFMDFLYFQIWRPSSTSSQLYHKIDEVQLQSDEQVIKGINDFLVNVTLSGDNAIEFQSGDVIGYYHPPDSRYLVLDIITDGYVQYQFNGSLNDSANISEANKVFNARQPLFEFTIGMKIHIKQSFIHVVYISLL